VVYLRPEDRIVEGLEAGQPHQCEGLVRRIDFLGGYLLVEVDVPGLAPLVLQVSLNQMHELGVREGEPLRFAIRAERLRVFPEAAA
jgi:iron(III) transport system ATP-binding protein